ncbi:MAG: exodeoxyribonuclease VII large subunit [Candidatus Competibacteraceae bacterium]|nr:exodeoxyribonuclease VII large subunit [Candidatus Competibacteraceae bacterium]
MPPNPGLTRDLYSVSRLNREARALLEGQFPALWVEGEVSNLTRPASGHLYFSLKDARAQIRCALFQHRALLFRDCPRNGQQVLARGRVSLYEPRGDFQFIVDYVEEAGAGALRRAYDELRSRLEREGCFAPERKKPLPRFPRRIGVITSPSGAAIRDVLATLARRCPGVPVLVYPVAVQGEGAAHQIARAIERASRRRDCEVLLLVRGGGSLEDLQAFNDEIVARAIFGCAVPLVTGIGHETDVTIADFAADLRAATPTAAAQLAGPDRAEWLARVGLLEQRLDRAARRALDHRAQRLDELAGRLWRQHPSQPIRSRARDLVELNRRLRAALAERLNRERHGLASLTARLHARTPLARLRPERQRLRSLALRLHAALRHSARAASRRLGHASERLQALSPLATLNRGYAILRRPGDGFILRRAGDAAVGETVEALLGEGRLRCEITAISATGSPVAARRPVPGQPP